MDGHRDVTAIAGAAGEVESRQSFDPWGNQFSGPSIEMGYLGAWERPSDSASGLIQMGARSYLSALGAFASMDPVLGHLGIGTSVNRYPYVLDDPSNRSDLDGQDVFSVLPTSPICILDCSPSEASEVGGITRDGVQDFTKEVGSVISHIHIGGGRECERKYIASSTPFFPCQEKGSLEFEENEHTYVPPIDPMGPTPVPGIVVPVPAPGPVPALVAP